MSDYEVFLAQPNGTLIKTLPLFISLQIGLTTNGVSRAELVLPGIEYDIDDFDRNYRVCIERDGVLVGDAPFFVKRKSLSLSGSGEYIISISAAHANHLLDAREILYYAGSSQAKATTEYADDLMRRLVDESLGANAAHADRDIAAPVSMITIESDTSSGPQISMSFARQELLDTLVKIADKSYKDGTPLYFGIEDDGAGSLEFRVRTDQWGANRTSDLVIGPDFANLTNVERSWDWQDEITVSAALGPGEGSARQIKTAENTTVTGIDDYHWRERATNASDASDDNLQADADAFLQSGRVAEEFRGELQQTSVFEFNVNWTWGDKVTAQFDGETITCWLNTVSINVSGGKEQISAKLEKVIT